MEAIRTLKRSRVVFCFVVDPGADDEQARQGELVTAFDGLFAAMRTVGDVAVTFGLHQSAY